MSPVNSGVTGPNFTNTQYTDNIYAVNAQIEVAISCSVSECQSDEREEFAISVHQILRYLFSYLLSNHDTLR